MNISPHFKLDEFTHSEYAVRNRIDNTPTSAIVRNLTRLADRMEIVRSMLGKPITISSGYRSQVLNSAIGGSKSSAHLSGNACDFMCPAFGRPKDIVARIRGEYPLLAYDQIILEFPNSPSGGWVHFGLADKPRGEVLVFNGKVYETWLNSAHLS